MSFKEKYANYQKMKQLDRIEYLLKRQYLNELFPRLGLGDFIRTAIDVFIIFMLAIIFLKLYSLDEYILNLYNTLPQLIFIFKLYFWFLIIVYFIELYLYFKRRKLIFKKEVRKNEFN